MVKYLIWRELLSKGLIKSIGDGRATHVWLENWIMDEVPKRPVNRHIAIDVNLKVMTLLHADGQWNTEVLQDFFSSY